MFGIVIQFVCIETQVCIAIAFGTCSLNFDQNEIDRTLGRVCLWIDLSTRQSGILEFRGKGLYLELRHTK